MLNNARQTANLLSIQYKDTEDNAPSILCLFHMIQHYMIENSFQQCFWLPCHHCFPVMVLHRVCPHKHSKLTIYLAPYHHLPFDNAVEFSKFLCHALIF